MESFSCVDGVLPEGSRSWRFWPWRFECGGSGHGGARGALVRALPPEGWPGATRGVSAALRMREIMTA
eukprot:11274469-Heterocapsa_arctica.AAC.1